MAFTVTRLDEINKRKSINRKDVEGPASEMPKE